MRNSIFAVLLCASMTKNTKYPKMAYELDGQNISWISCGKEKIDLKIYKSLQYFGIAGSFFIRITVVDMQRIEL